MSPCIMCGVDATTSTHEAVLVARSLSEQLGCRLVLVHAGRVPMMPGASVVPHAHDDLRKRALEECHAVLDRVRAEHRLGRGVESRAVLGHPVERLRTLAADEEAELLVVGTRGYGTLRAALTGSVSRALALEAPCPVVVVAPGAARQAFIDRAAPARRRASGDTTPPRTPRAAPEGGALRARRFRAGSR